MYEIVEIDGFLREVVKTTDTYDKALKWIDKHTYKGMSFKYNIVNVDYPEEGYNYEK